MSSKAQVPVSSSKILQLIDYMLRSGLAETKAEAFAAIKFNPHNLTKVKDGRIGFTVAQIEAACRVVGANANWIFGLESNMFRKPGSTPLEKLKEAVEAVELMLKTKETRKKKK